jgi:protein-disulfide isomerase
MTKGALLAVPVGPDDHVRGAAEAPLTLVEYGDYQCPYCGEAYPIVEALLSTFGNDVRFIFRNFPLVDVHPHAESAAEIAEAAGLQGKFWQMHDALYENQDDLGDNALVRYAQEIGLDTRQVQTDLTSGRPRKRVEADFEGAIRSGANGTPTFFVNGTRYDGSWQLQPFEAFITSQLKR